MFSELKTIDAGLVFSNLDLNFKKQKQFTSEIRSREISQAGWSGRLSFLVTDFKHNEKTDQLHVDSFNKFFQDLQLCNSFFCIGSSLIFYKLKNCFMDF